MSIHGVMYHTDCDSQARSLNYENGLSFVMSAYLSVCPHGTNNSVHAGHIFFTVDTR
jgi:hypothetical protein